jgi:hypothetical protein
VMLNNLYKLTEMQTVFGINMVAIDKVCQWLATDQWFSSGTPVSSTNKTDCHDITELLFKVA